MNNYYNNMYLINESALSYRCRINTGMIIEDIATLCNQEKFNSVCIKNASVGKNWYIKLCLYLWFQLEVKNPFNNQNIKDRRLRTSLSC